MFWTITWPCCTRKIVRKKMCQWVWSDLKTHFRKLDFFEKLTEQPEILASIKRKPSPLERARKTGTVLILCILIVMAEVVKKSAWKFVLFSIIFDHFDQKICQKCQNFRFCSYWAKSTGNFVLITNHYHKSWIDGFYHELWPIFWPLVENFEKCKKMVFAKLNMNFD